MPKVVRGYSEAAKARILEAAFEAFTHKGFDATTMEEIAGRVGVSKAALYRYYPSKDALLEELFKGGQRRLKALLDEAFADGDLEEGVSRFFDRLDRQYGQSYDLLFEWFAQAYRNDRLRRALEEDGRRDIETVSRFIEEQRKRGRLQGPQDARLLAQVFETAFTGAWVRFAMGHDRKAVMRSLGDLLSMAEHQR